MLSASLLWGGAWASPSAQETDAGALPQGVAEQLCAAATNPQSLLFKTLIGYVTQVNDVALQAQFDDTERVRAVAAVPVDTSAMQQALAAALGQSPDVFTTIPLQGASLTEQVDGIYTQMHKQGATQQDIKACTLRLVNTLAFAAEGKISGNRLMGAIAQLTDANKLLTYHAQHPHITQYALISAAALAVGAMVHTVWQHREPLSVQTGQLLAYLTFGPEAKSFTEIKDPLIMALYNSPVVDAIFTPLQLAMHPVETARAKPMFTGLLLTAGAVGCASVGLSLWSALRPHDTAEDTSRGTRWTSAHNVLGSPNGSPIAGSPTGSMALLQKQGSVATVGAGSDEGDAVRQLFGHSDDEDGK